MAGDINAQKSMNRNEEVNQLQLAEHCFRSGNVEFAEQLLVKIISSNRRNSRANELLAYIAGNRRDFDGSFQLLKKAAKEKDCSAEAFYYLGTLYIKKNEAAAAITVIKRSLEIGGPFFEGLHQLGTAYALQGRLTEALETYKKAESLAPDSHELAYNMGRLFDELKDHEKALAYYEKAIALKPDYVAAYNNLGIVLNGLRRYEAALQSYDKAIALSPDNAEAYNNRGITCANLKQYAAALQSYDRAIAFKPDYAEAYSNRGVTLRDLKRYEEALQSYDHAIALKPDYAEVYLNRGTALADLKHYDLALQSYGHAIELKPDYAEAYLNRGNTLVDVRQFVAAIQNYSQAIAIKPDIEFLHGNLLHTKMKICSWEGCEAEFRDLSKRIELNEKVAGPFSVLAIAHSPQLQKRAAEIWVQAEYLLLHKLPDIPKRPNKNKIRIGYFSPDFRNHPVALLTIELFEQHDRSKFEVVAFSYGPNTRDSMRKRLEETFDQFVDVFDRTDKEIALLARELGIDIAIDLGGHTQYNRFGIFAHRAAPIQVSYLGYPGTTGADYIDYLVADETIIPVASQAEFSEKIAYIPCYQVNSRRIISERKFTRKELGLPDTGFVFCCFNNSYKIMPDTFDSWARILDSVAGSVLWLYAENKLAEENLKIEIAKRGINPKRLIFATRIPLLEDHLARYRMADLFLDTHPYNAHTTASDALWAGLPVLTYPGETFASRVAASILKAIDLPELIAANPHAYEAKAVELAMHPDKLREISHKLANGRHETPLFDSQRFTSQIEAVYRRMYDRYQADLLPEHIHAN